jgi:dTDP-4-amino-4,6-dideoxygalactose transaminase
VTGAAEPILLSAPDVTDAEEAALVRAIRSGWVAPLGPEVDAFEAELAAFVERPQAVALSSGTAALHLGLMCLGVKPGSVVITSTMTFAATANAIAYCGATPVFVDSDATGNMDPELLREAIVDQRAGGAEIGAVLPVDLLGKVADHATLSAIAAEHGIPYVVDAAESLGARRDGVAAGGTGAISVVSFNGNKIMTTSGGGALLCDDADLAARVRYLATQARQPAPHYQHTEIGYNYRLSNLLAALGRAQLERLPSMMGRRAEWRRRYRAMAESIPGVSVFGGNDGSDVFPRGDHDNFWLTSIVVDPDRAGWTATELREALSAQAIEARPMWKPMHLQPVFADAPAYVNGTSEQIFTHGLSLPSGSGMSDLQFDRVVDAVGSFAKVEVG